MVPDFSVELANLDPAAAVLPPEPLTALEMDLEPSGLVDTRFFLALPLPPAALLAVLLAAALCELIPEVKCPSSVSTVADMLRPLVPFEEDRFAGINPPEPGLAPWDTIFPNKLTEFCVKSRELGRTDIA